MPNNYPVKRATFNSNIKVGKNCIFFPGPPTALGLDKLRSMMIQGKDTKHDMVLTLGSKVRPCHVHVSLQDTW